jgi:hypothetical protein
MPEPLTRVSTSIFLKPEAYASGHNTRQVRLLRRIAPILDPGFDPPDTVHSRTVQPHTEALAFRVGSQQQGFEVVHTIVYHPHWSFLAVDSVAVTAYGLPPGLRLSVTLAFSLSEWQGEHTTATLDAEVPEHHIVAITTLFEAEFAADRIPDQPAS